MLEAQKLVKILFVGPSTTTVSRPRPRPEESI